MSCKQILRTYTTEEEALEWNLTEALNCEQILIVKELKTHCKQSFPPCQTFPHIHQKPHRVDDLKHTYSLASLQWSGLSLQQTLLPTENCQ